MKKKTTTRKVSITLAAKGYGSTQKVMRYKNNCREVAF